jgi:hypothetical protein
MINAMTRPLAILVGFVGKIPVAGMTLYNLHYLLGLQELGFDVHYVERQNSPYDCYDPRTWTDTEDPNLAIGYLADCLPRVAGIGPERFSFVDLEGRCHGSGWAALCEALDRAEFVMTIADTTWFDELERCPRRIFVDGDPLFTQVDLVQGDTPAAQALAHYDTLFTYATRLGMADCSVPSAGREWLPTRPVVATSFWPVAPLNGRTAVTALLHWGAWNDYTYDGRLYGHKGREVERFAALPGRWTDKITLAVGGGAPRERLRGLGWGVSEAGEVTRTIDSYREFIAASRADFGIAKHAYVASRCGWFSDRSTCYLAAGRPVLHQETGFTDWLPMTGEGVLPFSDVDSALDALRHLDEDYAGHTRAARAIAEEHFEAKAVIGRMLADAGLRES